MVSLDGIEKGRVVESIGTWMGISGVRRFLSISVRSRLEGCFQE